MCVSNASSVITHKIKVRHVELPQLLAIVKCYRLISNPRAIKGDLPIVSCSMYVVPIFPVCVLSISVEI